MRSSKQSVWLLASLVGALVFQTVQAPGQSTPEERAEFIELTRRLESEPLSESSDATRARLQDWLTNIPDIKFHVCKDLLSPGLDDYPYAREFNLQVILSGAAFTLERQDKMRDEVPAYIAGVEGALRMYEVLRRSRPDARWAFLDDLLAIRDRGQLADHIATLAQQKCPTSTSLIFVALAGVAGIDLFLGVLLAWLFGRSKSDSPETRSPRLASAARWVVFLCVLYYVIVAVALHILEPTFDPRYRAMSDYAWSGYGPLMTTTFFALGLATLTLALTLRAVHRSTRSARLGFGLLVVGAIGICFAGVFRGFPLHDVAGAIGLPSVAMAVLFLSWSFRRSVNWQPLFWPSLMIGAVMLLALLSIVVNIGMPGLQQRIFLSLFLVWLAIIAQRSAWASTRI